jgi:hypothetical protein
MNSAAELVCTASAEIRGKVDGEADPVCGTAAGDVGEAADEGRGEALEDRCGMISDTDSSHVAGHALPERQSESRSGMYPRQRARQPVG